MFPPNRASNASPSCTPGEPPRPPKDQPHFHSKPQEAQDSAGNASYKLYYVNYEIGLDFVAGTKAFFHSFLLLVGGFLGFLLGEFVVDVLLEQMGIGAHEAAPIHEDRRRAVHVELLAVC